MIHRNQARTGATQIGRMVAAGAGKLLFALAALSPAAFPQAEARYAGPQVCAGCHPKIAATQLTTAMAKTWHGAVSSSLPAGFSANKQEGTPALSYQVQEKDAAVEFSATLPGGGKITLPVEEMVGGSRHGISFLPRLREIDGIPLARAPLLEARYAYSPSHKSLVLSPGFALEPPNTYEDSLGNVLSETFERKCLTCHGQPNSAGAAGKSGGVHCESCHGPAYEHLQAVGRGNPRSGVLNSAKLTGEASLAVCAQCHTGFTYQSDPLPDDLLVSNQVNALKNAECYRQSAGRITCTGCHDPHEDSPQVAARSRETCLSCHAQTASQHAAICPVSPRGDCVSCHMPSVQKGSFHMTDHWIRVHREPSQPALPKSPALRSTVTPVSEYLRLIATDSKEKADAARARLRQGETFSRVAREASQDPSAGAGGFLGEIELASMDQKLAAAAGKLDYGESSDPIESGGRWVLLERAPRDFKDRAGELFAQATAAHDRGDLKAAAGKDEEALEIYPFFLRALILLGTSAGEAGNIPKAQEILQFAAQTYPKDAPAQFNLALTLAADPAQQVTALRRALDLDPDMTAVYESLGAALFSAGDPSHAIDAFRQGVLIDPLSAMLNYDLGLALGAQGNQQEAERLKALALKLDPSITSRARH